MYLFSALWSLNYINKLKVKRILGQVSTALLYNIIRLTMGSYVCLFVLKYIKINRIRDIVFLNNHIVLQDTFMTHNATSNAVVSC